MSRKKIPAAQKTSSPAEKSAFYASVEGKPADFWWNFAYFLILSIAITFILVNNTLENVLHPTGIVILSILGFLDIFPTVYLIKFLIRFRRIKRSR